MTQVASPELTGGEIHALETKFLQEGLPAFTRGFDASTLSIQGFVSTFVRALVEVWKHKRAVRAAAIRGAPAVLVLIVALFVTSEVWRFFGPIGGGVRLIAVAALLLFLGVFTLGSMLYGELGRVYRTATRTGSSELKKLADKVDEARPVTHAVTLPETRENVSEFQLGWWQQMNIGLVLSAPLFAIALLVGVATFLTFVAIGFVGIDRAVTSEWISPSSGDLVEPAVRVRFSGLGPEFVLTDALLKVSTFLGSLAAVAFTSTAVRDRELREELITPKCCELTKLVAAWVFYRQATRNQRHDARRGGGTA